MGVETGLKNPMVLTSARDVIVYTRLSPDAKVTAILHGIITRVTKRGGIIFFILNDGTESIQLIAKHENFSVNDWETLAKLKISHRITVEAPVGYSGQGRVSLILNKIPQSSDSLFSSNLDSFKEISLQILLARLGRQARDFFIGKNFLEIEPKLISTFWESAGIQPLKVNYPGFGVAAYLAPSPAPQLLKTIIFSGNDNVFCISKCFTSTYRDSIAGAESLILSAKMLLIPFEEMVALARDSIYGILRNISTMPEKSNFLEMEWPVQSLESLPSPATMNLSQPEIQVFSHIPVSNFDNSSLTMQITKFFRICWPPNFILVEGFSGLFEGSVLIGSFTIHLEPMVNLLKPVETRRLPDLTETIPKSKGVK